MKFILSRKGFDSEYGGYASPIFPDGTMLSLPIPHKDRIRFSDINLGYGNYENCCEMMQDLMLVIKHGTEKITVDKDTTCHLDPDINPVSLMRQPGWRALFGQIDSAQTHLENKRVGKNDVFLFFGTFRKTVSSDGKLQFNKTDKEKHVIFGYLQIDKIIRMDSDARPEDWMMYHPHTEIKRRLKDNNTLYVARKTLSWNSSLPGASVFKYDNSLVLTKDGMSKSKWCLDPSLFEVVKISYHTQKSWKDGYFQSAAKGQEFVIEVDRAIEKYFKDLIEKNQ